MAWISVKNSLPKERQLVEWQAEVWRYKEKIETITFKAKYVGKNVFGKPFSDYGLDTDEVSYLHTHWRLISA